ncbi:MAG: hypothetical protein WA090_00905 [Candidatus Nanopelagicaceae bacterium]
MKASLYKHRWRLGIAILVAVALGAFVANQKSGSDEPLAKKVAKKLTQVRHTYPVCPKNLSGVLTAPLMDPKYITVLTPLGNINPPGHTSPVDHIYFATGFQGRIPLFAPADASITNLTEILKVDGSGKYIPTGYVVRYVVCDGLVLDFASYTSLIKPLRDELANQKPECKYGIVKPGHMGGPEGQCYYNMNYKVKSGEEIGWVQAIQRDQSLDLPFEIWAANYNKPTRPDVNWSYYNDNRYAHSMCTFDLYAGDLKKAFYSKFPRTIEPICGQVNQDVVGTIQGMWYGGDSSEKDLEFQGKGLAFLHNNFDPTQGEISIGGNFTKQAGVIMFKPTHLANINREPSEVKSDGKIYCYNSDQKGWSIRGKVLVQLVDDHHMRVEHLAGSCGSVETFQRAFDYQR